MRFTPSLVAVAIATVCAATQAQIFTNQETVARNNYLTAIGVPQAWARGITGKGSVIAVIDNGFSITHSDLAQQVIGSRNFYGYASFTWGLHGTQMASIAAGAANGSGTVGVAPDAKLLLAQAGNGGTTSSIDMASVRKAMTWADAQGATVINLSLGSTYDSTFKANTVQIAPGIYRADPKYGRAATLSSSAYYAALYSQSLADMVAFTSATRNAVVVASAGNSASGYAQFPGAFATRTDANGNLLMGGRVLIVGNVKGDGKGGWVMDASSNRAGSLCFDIVNNVCQDKYYVRDFYVVAPGNAILGAVPDQARTPSAVAAGSTNGVGGVSGTSPSAALVSGGIALMRQAWPQLNSATLVRIVLDTATPLGDSNVYGKGMVNFDRATQPISGVRYTTAALGSGPAVGGSSISGSGLAASGNVGAALRTSSVLQGVQVVDGLNRNFSADLTRAIGVANPTNPLYTSPYLAMQSLGYRETAIPYGRDTVMTFMQSVSGVAAQIEARQGAGRIRWQAGAMTEINGFLNNTGSGLFALGGSQTGYAMIGGSYPLARHLEMMGSYGMGITRTRTVQDSLLAVSPTLLSDTWKLGIAWKDLLFNGKVQDEVSLALHGPVAVRHGSMKVSAVTGYTYSGAEDNVTATPVVTSQKINLAQGQRQQDLMLGYSVSLGNHTRMGISVGRQFNVGGISGQTGTAAALMVRSVF